VFDCAIPVGKGGRSIAPMGHVKMMAAAQPFISGAISKTCNLPESATVDDIKQIYVDAWKMGLKSHHRLSRRVEILATARHVGAGGRSQRVAGGGGNADGFRVDRDG
jgi:ribonucleotide reductase alpha subunit